jgi:hypothetical protein
VPIQVFKRRNQGFNKTMRSGNEKDSAGFQIIPTRIPGSGEPTGLQYPSVDYRYRVQVVLGWIPITRIRAFGIITNSLKWLYFLLP